MSKIRKSLVSTKNTQSQDHNTEAELQRTTANLFTDTENTSMSTSKYTVIQSQRKRKSRENLLDNLISRRRRKNTAHTYQPKLMVDMNQQVNENIPKMSNARGSTPIWLLRLNNIYRYSSFTAFFLVAATLIVYGWTVYSQELWSKSYGKIKDLQRNERQLTSTNAALTSKLAKEGEKAGKRLVSPSSQKTIFLPSTYYPTNSSPSKSESETNTQKSQPLGY